MTIALRSELLLSGSGSNSISDPYGNYTVVGLKNYP